MERAVAMLSKVKRNIASYARRSGRFVSGYERAVQVRTGAPAPTRRPPAPPVDGSDGTVGDASWSQEEVLDGVDASGTDARGHTVVAQLIANSSFDDSKLQGLYVGSPKGQLPGRMPPSVMDTTFRRTNLRGAQFENVLFDDVSFEGANLLDATFTNCGLALRGSVNFHGALLNGDAVDALLTNTNFLLADQFLYRRLAASEAQEALGVSDDDFAVAIWAGDVEVRDNVTLQRVIGVFDADRHHIPEWVVNVARHNAAPST